MDAAPLLTVFGGKITTFRRLAEEAVDRIAPLLGNHRTAWTAAACLPGGDIYGATPGNRAVLNFSSFVHAMQQQYAWLPAALVARYAHAYGTRIHVLLAGRASLADMGGELAPGLWMAEAEYLRRYEWATCEEDMLWRRSKLGVHAD
jgi:glycerol-3-phosphate dehydrogenase